MIILCCIGVLIALELQAATISGPQITSGGKIVSLSGQEWMPLTEADAGQFDANQMISAFTDPVSDFYGWRYATRSEAESLMDSLWGGTVEGLDVSNYDGASWFFDNFGVGSSISGNGGYGPDGTALWSMGYGPGECGSSLSICMGFIRIKRVAYGSIADAGYFTDSAGLSVGLDDVNIGTGMPRNHGAFSNPNTDFSHLLVRSSVVPVPAAVWLFGSGLLGLVGLARRKKAA